MHDFEPSKDQLRRELRRRRRAIDATRQAVAARGVARSIARLSGWRDARRVGLYLAADGEIDTVPLAERARASGKQLFLPVIQPDSSLDFAAWHRGVQLSENRYGIPEPPPESPRCPVGELDILFLPLVGWDRQGGRLGMGGGFYDRTLAGVGGPQLVGLAHGAQEVRRVPRDDWDVRLDFVATDAALHRCQGVS